MDFDQIPSFDQMPEAPPILPPDVKFDDLPQDAGLQNAAPAAPLAFDQLPEAPPPNLVQRPQTNPNVEKTNGEVPGFWSTVGSAFGRGVVQRTVDDIAGAQVALPAGLGGKTLEQQYQEGLLHPDTKDEIDNLLGKRVNEGWSDPKWWGAQVAHGAGGMVPAVGGAAVGSLARVPVPVTFGVEGGLGALVPAYKKAREAGLDPEAATTRALVDSGIAAGTATAMGIAPSFSLFGKTAVAEQTAQMLKRPVMEMLAQLGLVQPSLAVTGEIVRDLSHGEAPDPWSLATTYVVGAAQGVPIVGNHAAMSAVRTMRSRAIPAEPPATPEQVQRSFQNQAPLETGRPDVPPPVEGFVANEQDPETQLFYSPVRETIAARMPPNAPVHEVLGILRSPGIKAEEINDLSLPAYLADSNGKVNKEDLLAHIDANAVRVTERRFGEQEGEGNAPRFPDQNVPGAKNNPREFVFSVPVKKEPEEVRVEQRARDIWDYNYSKEFGPWERAGEAERNNMRENARAFILDDDLTTYTSGHFNIPNEFMQIRTTDRVARNGERVLFVDEIQSDAHQRGAKVGYMPKDAAPADLARLEYDVKKFHNEYVRIQKNEKRIGVDTGLAAQYRARWKEAIRAFDAGVQMMEQIRGKVPDLPFKTSWQELAVKRLMQVAANEGYDGIAFATGDQVGLRLGEFKELQGARINYDQKISSLAMKWAKKMGMGIERTQFEGTDVNGALAAIWNAPRKEGRAKLFAEWGLDKKFNRDNLMVKLNPAAGDRIRQGLPLYETGPEQTGGGIQLNAAFMQRGQPKKMQEFAEPLKKIIGKIGEDVRVSLPIEFEIGPRRTRWRGQADRENGRYVIRINTRLLSRFEDMYATAVHELGHVIMWDKFAGASESLRTQVREAFHRYRMQLSNEARTMGDLRRIRDNPVSEMTGGRDLPRRGGGTTNSIPLSDLTPSSRAYVMHFEEWFAEQTAKWATTSEKPLGVVDKFFKQVGDIIRKLVMKFRGERKESPEAVPEIQQWLDSLYHDGKKAADLLDQLDLDSTRRNADAMDRDGASEVQATPQTASTSGGRNLLGALPPDTQRAGAASAAYADRFNKFYEWMTSLPQIADLNKHIRPLQLYREIVATMNLEKNNIMGAAWETLRAWKLIRDPKQQVAIGKFIEDYMNGQFKLVDDGVIRRPTQAEFTALAQKHGMSDQSLRLFDRLVRDFDGLLESYRQLLLADAFRIKDPNAQLDAIQAVNKRVDELLQRPYFPAMRFGKYTITVYDSAGNVRHFEQTEDLRKQRKIAEALSKSPDLLPGDRIRTGQVPKDAAPLLGMPPGLIDLIATKLNLSDSQRSMLDQLRFDYAPSQSFRHQFRQKDLTPGYSSDFQRAYANFFFHGANHITRVKWVDALRDQIREVKEGSIDLNDANKRDGIANYLTQHLGMLVDPKPDFAALRAMMFHWYLGFNPASATLNLSQTPLMTYPHLASKFGDLGAVKALLKASADLNNFYKKGNLVELAKTAPPGPEGAPIRALGEAVREGVISETQAHTLAAVSEGRNMLRAFGTKTEELWHNFSEASSWMFEMAEQYNRRVAFRAAWDLAMRDPNAKYVRETVADNRLLYDRLTNPRLGGMTHQEASAFVAAKDSVEKSQFVYAPYARPKFMWGKAGSLFIFKSFVQNTLFNLWSNPSMAARHLVIMGALGGLMGLPGAEDINGILKALGWHLFGKDFDVEDQARKFAVDVLDGKVNPDMLLHGMSVKGFGIPQVLNGLGAQVGLPKIFPTLDRHQAVGMGNILPFEPGKLFGPTKDVKANEIAQLQRASGAGFSNVFALYEFLNSQDSRADLKKWEKIMPRALGNLSHAFRYLRNGQETNKAGDPVVRFDVSDTEHMAEILARAMGYQPRRLTGAWEAMSAKQEQATFWDLRKQVLLRQFGEAVKVGNTADRETVLQAIRKYNQEIAGTEARGKAISSQTLKDSVYQRLRRRAQTEAGLPYAKQNYELFRSLDKYFPDGRPTGQVDARPVR